MSRVPPILADAGALLPLARRVIDWLDGTVETTHTHLGPPTSETQELIGLLRDLNVRGLVTDESQPARPNQRAWVDLVTIRAYAEVVHQAATAAGLWCAEWPIGDPPSWVVGAYVTWLELEDGEKYLVTASCGDGRVLDVAQDPTLFEEPGRATLWAEDLLSHTPHHDVFLRCHHVTVIDPMWDRRDRLWRTLRDATHDLPVIT